MENLVKAVKVAAIQAIENNSPLTAQIATVTSDNPLKLKIGDVEYDKEFLILTRNVTDYKTELTINDELEVSGDVDGYHGPGKLQTLTLPSRMSATIHNNLKQGDIVLVLRQQGGQKFIIWDRVV